MSRIVWFVIRVTVYGKTSKHTSIIHHLKLFFYGDVQLVFGVTLYGNTGKHHREPFRKKKNSMVMSEW